MRAFLVLILVLAASAAFFFVISGGDGSEPGGGGAITGPATEGPVVADEPARTDLETADLTTPKRVASEVEKTQVETPAASPTNRAAEGRGRLIGTVIDANDAPISGAEVRLTRYGSASLSPLFLDPSQPRVPDLTAKTNARGEFEFPSVAAYDQYAIVATHPKFSRSEREPVAVVENKVTEERNIRLVTGASLSGRITDEGGNNVPDAEIRVQLQSFAASFGEEVDSYGARSDAEGRYRIDNLAPGNYSMRVEADGYGGMYAPALNISGVEPMTKDVVLALAHMIGGMVRTPEGLPIEGVEVQVWSMSDRTNQSRSSVRTDAQGKFLVQDVTKGTYLILANHPAYEAEQRNLRAETGDMSIVVVMRAHPRIRGQVLSSASNAPITSFTVQLRSPIPNAVPETTMADPRTRTTVLDPEGRFDIAAPKPGTWRVHAMAPGHADTVSAAFEVIAGTDVNNVVVRMIAGGTVRGRVVDTGGRPVSGARVSSHHKDWADDAFSLSISDVWLATQASAVTDSDGRYELKNLMPMTYQIVVKHADYAGATLRDVIAIDGQENLVRDIVLPNGSTVSGTVYGPNGSPLAGAMVRLHGEVQTGTEPFGGPYSTRTDEAGRYTFQNVKQGTYGAWATRPRGPQSPPLLETTDMNQTKKTISVRDGANVTQDFTLGE